MSEQIANWNIIKERVVHALGYAEQHKYPLLGALAGGLLLVGGIEAFLRIHGQSDQVVAPVAIKSKSQAELVTERAQVLLTTPGIFGDKGSFIEEMKKRGYWVLWEWSPTGSSGIIRTGSAGRWGLIERQVPSLDGRYPENGRIRAGECVSWATEVTLLDTRQESSQGEVYVVTLDGHFLRKADIENGIAPGAEGLFINVDDPNCPKFSDEAFDLGRGKGAEGYLRVGK